MKRPPFSENSFWAYRPTVLAKPTWAMSSCLTHSRTKINITAKIPAFLVLKESLFLQLYGSNCLGEITSSAGILEGFRIDFGDAIKISF